MTWQMYAGRDTRNGGFRDFGHPRTVQMFGHTEIVPVELIEDPEGPYYGWLDSTGRYPDADPAPKMIQQHRGLFQMQFPYGYKAEEERGHGRMVRLSARELEG